MENKRPIHPDNPWYYMDGDQINVFYNEVNLRIEYKPTSLAWWDKGWAQKVLYHPNIACGIIRSKHAFPVNTSFECEVKAPEGNNLWFSFWLTACDSWPPEIDIFEGYTDKNGSCFDKLGLHWRFPFLYRDVRMESNVHYKDDKEIHRHISPKGDHKSMFKLPLESSWNHFRCEWREDSIKFYINNNLHRVVKDKKILSKMKTKGMWMIFNVWPNDRFDLSKDGDIRSFTEPFTIRNFKTAKI